ncbi:adenylate kinase-domain containing protein [Nitzschia inconspicua]|uniref:Adenylate kinase-domain containing protein n=1 Tax=Nitzschia inconspicua TaxID=303405 RepID=A0A9K3PWR9_9STRA|nr:adenylate kinase-domain containing protein [Nitzschia inconspicua]
MLIRRLLFHASNRTLSVFEVGKIGISGELPRGVKKFHCRPYSSTTALSYQHDVADSPHNSSEESQNITPGSRAFVDCELFALVDLFDKYALPLDTVVSNHSKFINLDGLRRLMHAVGESPSEKMLQKLFDEADADGNGVIDQDEFLMASDSLLGGAPAGIVLLVGGPGSGKGVLSRRLEEECGVVHLSSGDLLREEVRRDTILGREVKEVMDRGELVSSAVIVKLIRRVMRTHAPGKRVLLDGFPRSQQNAEDLMELCGIPELAIHLNCEDTTMMERILKRKEAAVAVTGKDRDGHSTTARADDNIHTALERLRTYHKSQKTTMDWLHEQHVPIINLDGSGTPDQVWEQLLAIGRLMRPACTIESRALPRGPQSPIGIP